MKSKIRKMLINKRNDLPKETVKRYSNMIFNNFKNLDIDIKNKNVMIYKDFNNEVKTETFIKYLESKNCKIILPKVNFKQHRLELYQYENNEQLIKSKYGIFEPKGNKKEFSYKNIDIIIVPGVGYRNDKYRIGYGGGFYDR